jgi:hypothetical protein
MNITRKWEGNISKVLNKNGNFMNFTHKYMALSTNLNRLPIGGYKCVMRFHASTTYHVFRSHNNEMDLSWTY